MYATGGILPSSSGRDVPRIQVLDASFSRAYTIFHTRSSPAMTEATPLSPGSMSASYVTYQVDRVMGGAEEVVLIPRFMGPDAPSVVVSSDDICGAVA